MFERQFGLRENPFVAGHQARFVYPSREHQEALAHLRYGIENREPFVLITGEVGTGKTTALYDVLGEWQSRVVVALITNSALTRDELLEEICLRFGVPSIPGATKPQLLQHLERDLLAVRARGERAILILDEAQNLSRDLLEEIRLLSNLEIQGDKLVQVFLVGQPELEATLARPELRQLRQRIAVHYRLNPLSDEDTERYIHHRLSVAGGNAVSVFPSDACRVVFQLTHGIPREINTVAAQAMLNAFVEGEDSVAAEHVAAVARDTEFQSVVRGSPVRAVSADTPEPAPPSSVEALAPPRAVAPDPSLVVPPAPASAYPSPPTPSPRLARPSPPAPAAPAQPVAADPVLPGLKPHQSNPDVRAAASADAWEAWKSALASIPGGESETPHDSRDESAADDSGQGVTPPSDRPALQVVQGGESGSSAPLRATPAAIPAPEEPLSPWPSERPPGFDDDDEELRAALARPQAERSGVASEALEGSTLPPRLRRKLEFEETEPEPNPMLRWLAIAAIVVVVVIGAILASRFLGGARKPAQSSVPAAATTPAERAPAPSGEPATSANGAPPGSPATTSTTSPRQQGPAPASKTPATASHQASSTSPVPAPAAARQPAATAGTTTPAAKPKPSTTTQRPAASSATTKPVAPAPASTRAFGVAVRTLLFEDRAREEAQRLGASSGMPSRVLPVTDKGETSYRVVLGSFPDRTAAERAAGRLIEQGLADEARVVSFEKQ